MRNPDAVHGNTFRRLTDARICCYPRLMIVYEFILNGEAHVAIVSANGSYAIEVTHGIAFPKTHRTFPTFEAASHYIANVSYKTLLA